MNAALDLQVRTSRQPFLIRTSRRSKSLRSGYITSVLVWTRSSLNCSAPRVTKLETGKFLSDAILWPPHIPLGRALTQQSRGIRGLPATEAWLYICG
ncbi:hypothetical protein RRG08_056401 [Elysia crispata]|uniref:Uncharacterized protein n=1 Tax=Elysia crispata TaxID=231223 RepID=A0AAE1D7F7_9GAST|nr:hypothetical protein RRG08_056401 [Elysia crispata]